MLSLLKIKCGNQIPFSNYFLSNMIIEQTKEGMNKGIIKFYIVTGPVYFILC